MSEPAQRAAIYLRISQDRENDRLGVDRHQEDAELLVQRRDWQLVDICEDNDTTGSGRKQREHFERLLADVEAGLIDVIVAQEWPRLERNRSDGVRIIEAAQRHHVLLTFAKGSDIDCSTAAGRLSADMFPRWPATRSRSKQSDSPAPSCSVPDRAERPKDQAPRLRHGRRRHP